MKESSSTKQNLKLFAEQYESDTMDDYWLFW